MLVCQLFWPFAAPCMHVHALMLCIFTTQGFTHTQKAGASMQDADKPGRCISLRAAVHSANLPNPDSAVNG
jgi:hypothetical protein